MFKLCIKKYSMTMPMSSSSTSLS